MLGGLDRLVLKLWIDLLGSSPGSYGSGRLEPGRHQMFWKLDIESKPNRNEGAHRLINFGRSLEIQADFFAWLLVLDIPRPECARCPH